MLPREEEPGAGRRGRRVAELGEGGGEARAGFAAGAERVGLLRAPDREPEPEGAEEGEGRDHAGQEGLVAEWRARGRGNRQRVARDARRWRSRRHRSVGFGGRFGAGGGGGRGVSGFRFLAARIRRCDRLWHLGGDDRHHRARRGDGLVRAAGRIEEREGDGPERVRAPLGGDEDDILRERDIEELALGRRALGLRLDDLEIVGDVALRQAIEIGPVARATELEGPGDGLAHGGLFGHDLGGELELAHGPGEIGRGGRGQGADREGGVVGLDGDALEARRLEETEADAARLQAHHLDDALELHEAGCLRVGARAVGDVELGLAVDDVLAGLGLRPILGDEGRGVPIGHGFELAEIAAVDVEGVEQREDLAGPHGVAARRELGGCGVVERGIARCRGRRKRGHMEIAPVGLHVERGDGDGRIGPRAEAEGQLHVVGAAEIDELGARALAGEIGLHALDRGQARRAGGLAILVHEDELGRIVVRGFPAHRLRGQPGGEREKEQEGEEETWAHGHYQSFPFGLVPGLRSPSMSWKRWAGES